MKTLIIPASGLHQQLTLSLNPHGMAFIEQPGIPDHVFPKGRSLIMTIEQLRDLREKIDEVLS